MTAKKKKETFETALERLEEIVEKLEDGEVSLDEALALFQEGRKLGKECSERLKAVEKKARILLEEEDGSVSDRPLDGDDEEEIDDAP